MNMNKTALITGSAGGIGQALCSVFRDAGYRIIGLDIKPGTHADDIFIMADLHVFCTDTEYRSGIIDSVVKNLGGEGLWVLINNAAIQVVRRVEAITPENWTKTLNINLMAPFLLSQALLPNLEKAGGCIVNMASIHSITTKPEFVCYATSKSALVGLTKSMAVELGGRVRVNAICPAAVATPMLLAGFEGKEHQFKELSKMHPIGRIGTPEEIAQVALFLASPAAGFVTGAIIYADGGIGSRLHDPI
jgi:NAD(P)-dependent dehydrogenase (short-subunit alcohol dehydrogenase family)